MSEVSLSQDLLKKPLGQCSLADITAYLPILCKHGFVFVRSLVTDPKSGADIDFVVSDDPHGTIKIARFVMSLSHQALGHFNGRIKHESNS